MTLSRILTLSVIFGLISTSYQHNWLHSPVSRGDQQHTQTGCRLGGEGNPTCAGPCDRTLAQAYIAPIRTARGQRIDLQWNRHTHPGGFIRFAWSPTSQSDSHSSFDQHVQRFVCKETGGCGGTADSPNGLNCAASITVPNWITDGTWTLQWAYFGGWYNAGDYYACVDYTISGGNAVEDQQPADFIGGDYSYPNENACSFYSTNALHVCKIEPCTTGTFTPGEHKGVPLGFESSSGRPSTTTTTTTTTGARTTTTTTTTGRASTSSSTTGRTATSTSSTSSTTAPVQVPSSTSSTTGRTATSSTTAPVQVPSSTSSTTGRTATSSTTGRTATSSTTGQAQVPSSTSSTTGQAQVPSSTSTTGRTSSVVPTSTSGDIPSDVIITNCAGLTRKSTSSILSVEGITYWGNGYSLIIKVTFTQPVTGLWYLDVLFPPNQSGARFIAAYNAGSFKCQNSRGGVIQSSSWASSPSAGSSFTVEVSGNNPNSLSEESIRDNTVFYVYTS